MDFLTELWMPILLSSVFVFIASSVLHMCLPLHRGDVQKLPGEDSILETIRSQSVPPGDYMFPGCESMKDMGNAEMLEKFKRGPVGLMTVYPAGGFNIGKSLGFWFVYTLVIGVFVAYVASFSMRNDATDYLDVFRLCGTVAFIAYGMGAIPNSIWKGTKWSTTLKFAFDGFVYALLTGGTFGWLWPGNS